MIKLALIWLLFALSLWGCSGVRPDVRDIKSGILKQDMSMSAFVDTWGPPDRTRIVDGKAFGYQGEWDKKKDVKDEVAIDASDKYADKNVIVDVVGAGASDTKGKFTSALSVRLQEWEYKKYGTFLYFIEDKLIDWKNDKTVLELKEIYERENLSK